MERVKKIRANSAIDDDDDKVKSQVYFPMIFFTTRLVRLTWVVLEMGGNCPYSYCFVGWCF